MSFLEEYKKLNKNDNSFYKRWLEPLFFEALNSFGKKVAYKNNNFSKELEDVLLMAPYLNGGLFRIKPGFDDLGYFIPDKEAETFFEFLFSHSFTIEENRFEDEDLQLNPEFLGIIFERIVNKADGAVYTPRTEVDFMCRLSLVKWLEKNTSTSIQKQNLYELFFREAGKGDDYEDRQKDGSFSKSEIEEILNLLENITVCDPAVGSGAFIVGMLQVLDEIIVNLSNRLKLNTNDIFERKKRIISNSLYGVEVKEWAVWICQLRLWISIFIDAPDELKYSPIAILPSLEFKIRQGDSLIQRIGNKMFPVMGHADVKGRLKSKINELKKIKSDYFYNKSSLSETIIKEKEISLYQSIIDEEIEELTESLRRKGSIEKVTKTGLFSDPNDISSQEVLVYDQKELTELRSKITELLEQRSKLRIDKPLIWNIEFAEIFVEKDGFDLVIGNPPYVRSGEISDPTGKIKDKGEYKKLLEKMVKLDFPKYFMSMMKIDANSDLFTYFYVRSLRLLNNKGYHNFICSSSWLDVGYGSWLQKFLLDNCKIDFIIDNHFQRSFSSAGINTIISNINAPLFQIDHNNIVKFIAFKKSFEESVFTENLLQIENSDDIILNNDFRLYPISNEDLNIAGSETAEDNQTNIDNISIKKIKSKYIGNKWGGRYLRAPEIFYIVTYKGKSFFRKLKDIATIRRGFSTGVNSFFYITKQDLVKWKIEDKFIRKVLKSPKDYHRVNIDVNDLNNFVIMCNLSKNDLQNTRILKYIIWGENQRNENKIHWCDLPSVKNRNNWYELFENSNDKFIIPRTFNTSYICYNGGVNYSDRFYGIETEYDQLIMFLNSTLFALFSESLAKQGLGLGALDLNIRELKEIPVLYEFNTFFEIQREIKSVFVECGINPDSEIPIEEQKPNPLPDRAELDKIIFDALGLTLEERKQVYRAVCRLVWNRINKAKSV